MDVDLQACIAGDKRAWDGFVDRYARVIFAAVRRTIRRGPTDAAPEEIDDAAQNVFLRLIKDDYRLLRSFDPDRASMVTWLTLVARSTAIDHLRRRHPPSQPLQPADVAEPAAADQGRNEGPELPLHVLTARQRLVLCMLFDAEMSVPEAARTLGVDEQTVRSTKHKALTRLREQMGASDRSSGGRG